MPYSSGRYVPLCKLAEVAMWALVVALLAAGTVIGVIVGVAWFPVVLALIAHGLALSAAAATVSIRNMLLVHAAQTRDAFDMGREVGGGNVEPIVRSRS